MGDGAVWPLSSGACDECLSTRVVNVSKHIHESYRSGIVCLHAMLIRGRPRLSTEIFGVLYLRSTPGSQLDYGLRCSWESLLDR
eukprot:g81502.t1